MLLEPLEFGAAVQIAAGAAQLVSPLTGADSDGAVGRAAAIGTSCAAGVLLHPFQAPINCRPVYDLPAGNEGRPHGNLAFNDVFFRPGGALGHSAVSKWAGSADDATGPGLILDSVHSFSHQVDIIGPKYLYYSFHPPQRL